ncbi:thiamine-phosphate kinase [Desulfitibacter alkalitolerans]|uniref:thiamine-phosphate kinase n=1 Tax=Desulfitibacter alkalitolerans TaxID=264641 RepID=UPI0004872B86|nr:thiamine-phosphate kinase [Desulfitibacter alkalitolerans]
MKISEYGEFKLIEKIAGDTIYDSQRVIVGIGDDTAAEKVNPGHLLLSTCDALVDGVHFLLDKISPGQLGRKAVAVNLSDIAAMGGRPTSILITLALPRDTAVNWVEDLYVGIKEMCSLYKVNIMGGDMVSSPVVSINITALGEVKPENIIKRAGACIGDAILVTGPLGDSGGGLEIIKRGLEKDPYWSKLVEKHLNPMPQVLEGQFLAKTGFVTSMNDISDGLASEIREISDASRVGIELWEESIPYSSLLLEAAEEFAIPPINLALSGGEDYQLVFTCKGKRVKQLMKGFAQEFSREVHLIGEIKPVEYGIKLRHNNGQCQELLTKGYNHFA